MERDVVARTLELALSELSPTATDKARHRASLGLQGPDATAAGQAPESTSGAAAKVDHVARGWTALRASGGAGWTAGALLLSAGIGLGFWLRGAVTPSAPQPGGSASPPAAGTQPPTASEPPAPAAPAALEPAGERPTPQAARAIVRERAVNKPERRPAGHAGAGGAEPFSPQPFDAELALLRRVERALRANNPSLATVLLDELDQSFPETRLGEERQAARRIAECRLQLPGWRQRAERFLSEQRSSVYGQRVRAACSPE